LRSTTIPWRKGYFEACDGLYLLGWRRQNTWQRWEIFASPEFYLGENVVSPEVGLAAAGRLLVLPTLCTVALRLIKQAA
jgi:hypothetical protein